MADQIPAIIIRPPSRRLVYQRQREKQELFSLSTVLI